MRIIAIANQKGGVGKTSTCVNLAAALGQLKKKVLLIDMDPQGNSTSGLGIDRKHLDKSIYDSLVNTVPIREVITPTRWENVFLAPATIDLAGAEVELASAVSRETRLRNALQQLTGFDCALIDCPPSLGLLTLNSLVGSNTFMVPIQCEYYALEGLSQLMQTIELVKNYLNNALELQGIILTMYDSRTRLSKEVVEEVKVQFKEKVYETIIPRNVRISEAPSFGSPVLYYDPSSVGAIAYKELATEVLQKW